MWSALNVVRDRWRVNARAALGRGDVGGARQGLPMLMLQNASRYLSSLSSCLLDVLIHASLG